MPWWIAVALYLAVGVFFALLLTQHDTDRDSGRFVLIVLFWPIAGIVALVKIFTEQGGR